MEVSNTLRHLITKQNSHQSKQSSHLRVDPTQITTTSDEPPIQINSQLKRIIKSLSELSNGPLTTK